jgi:hypothetical protein
MENFRAVHAETGTPVEPLQAQLVASFESAKQLCDALTAHKIKADVHDGYGIALVSVWVDLVVACDQQLFWWRTGWNRRRRRPIYARHSTGDVVHAAERIARRYAELRQTRPPLRGLFEGRPGPL